MLPRLRHIWQGWKYIDWKYIASTSIFFGAGGAIFINDNVVETTWITGRSMAPTLSPNYHTTKEEDQVLWRKWNPCGNLRRGDIVHFSPPHRPEALAVKRVIALEGDTVVLDKHRRPTAKAGPERPEARAWDAWKGRATVPPGHVWVEGDNVGLSTDSNDYGPISMGLINGVAISVVRPFDKFWSKPWEGFKCKTKVVTAKDGMNSSLPVELAEIQDPHLPR